MLINKENQNIAISSLITVLIFLTLLIVNYQNYNKENVYIFSFFKYLPQQINLIFIYVILPTLIFIFFTKILLKYVDFL